MSINQHGKNQSFSREVNNKLVLEKLLTRPYSQTELADELALSNATMSSIAKELLSSGIIKILNSSSKAGLGRRQVFYTINENYGLILVVNISNFQATIAISNLKEEILTKEIIDIDKYDLNAIYSIILLSSKLLLNGDFKDIELKAVVISLPGRVNSKTGELMLSKQFDPALFKEKNFIANAFKKQYPNAEVISMNDINLAAYAELSTGELVDVDNAIFISIDTGIGGSLIINHKLFEGDQGYAGEFGLIKVKENDEYDYLDELVSFRILSLKGEKLTKKKINSRSELVALYNSNADFKKIVLESGKTLGKAIKTLIETLDISTVIISGRAVEFDGDYLKAINEELSSLIYPPVLKFSSLKREGKIKGATSVGLKTILMKSISK